MSIVTKAQDSDRPPSPSQLVLRLAERLIAGRSNGELAGDLGLTPIGLAHLRLTLMRAARLDGFLTGEAMLIVAAAGAADQRVNR